ncbi:type VII secretion system-associated protein [Streptomyces sp. NPDC002911]
MTDLTSLDAPALQSFIDTEIGEFKTEMLALRTSNGDRKSLYDLGNATVPLVIGNLAGDEETGGKKVVTNMVTAAKAVDDVLARHTKMVDDLELCLRRAIEKMQKTQKANLVDVEGQTFLSLLAGTETSMNGAGTNLPGGNGTT